MQKGTGLERLRPGLSGFASVADLSFLPAWRRVLRRNLKSIATLESYS